MKWFPADVSKGPLPFPSKICSLDWKSEKQEQAGVGEVWNTPRPFKNIRRTPLIDGNHICGTEDEFRNGELLDVTRPLTVYSPSGIPLCCDPNRREADVRLSVIMSTYYTAEGVYRSSVRVAAAPATFEVRSDPYTSEFRVSSRFDTSTQRSEPYHSSLFLAVELATSTEDTPAYFSRPMVAITMGSHYTSSIVCADLAALPLDAPLTWVDHWCVVLLPNYDDAVIVFPTGWRQYEVTPDTDYEFDWFYLLGTGLSGDWELWRGDETGPIVLIDTGTLIGVHDERDFNSGSYDRVFLKLIEPHSDTSTDELHIRIQTL